MVSRVLIIIVRHVVVVGKPMHGRSMIKVHPMINLLACCDIAVFRYTGMVTYPSRSPACLFTPEWIPDGMKVFVGWSQTEIKPQSTEGKL